MTAAALKASIWSSRTGPARSPRTARSKTGPRPGVPRPSTTSTANPWSANHCEVWNRASARCTRWAWGPP